MFGKVLQRFAGEDPKMGRLVRYWCVIFLLYVMYLSLPWIQVSAGLAGEQAVAALTLFGLAGNVGFYFLIRNSRSLNLTPAQLSVYQGRFAIIGACLGYTLVGPIRGASLVVLLVILIFCAFTLPAKKTYSLSLFSVVLLGASMLAMRIADSTTFDVRTELIHFVLVGTMVIVVGILTGRMSDLRITLRQQKAELVQALARIQEMADRDELTHLLNRRSMLNRLQLEKLRPEKSATCVALLDIDHFKRINDTYGHAAGDAVLRRFADEGSTMLRPTDVLARWGGEEFLLLLPNTDLASAKGVVERFCAGISQTLHHHHGLRFSVTVSAGVVELASNEQYASGISRADALLYQAKADGRNQVVVEEPGVAVPWHRLVEMNNS
jgi:diguanylate cyclase (GGDEF)-like protein